MTNGVSCFGKKGGCLQNILVRIMNEEQQQQHQKCVRTGRILHQVVLAQAQSGVWSIYICTRLSFGVVVRWRRKISIVVRLCPPYAVPQQQQQSSNNTEQQRILWSILVHGGVDNVYLLFFIRPKDNKDNLHSQYIGADIMCTYNMILVPGTLVRTSYGYSYLFSFVQKFLEQLILQRISCKNTYFPAAVRKASALSDDLQDVPTCEKYRKKKACLADGKCKTKQAIHRASNYATAVQHDH